MSNARLLPLLLFAACSADERPPVPPPCSTAPPVLAAATQRDLGRELDDAERRGTWTEVRRAWQGQRLRWTVTRHRMLCRIADACHVAAFPVQRPAPHGWMPRVEFAAGEFDRLQAACGDAASCDFTFEATLTELDVTGDTPTKLRFTGARLL